MAKIRRIEPNIPRLGGRKRVAAYARVSMETELLHHSLSAHSGGKKGGGKLGGAVGDA